MQLLVHNLFMAWKQDEEQLWAGFLAQYRAFWSHEGTSHNVPGAILTRHLLYATVKAWKFYMAHFPSDDPAWNLHIASHPLARRGFRAFADRTNDTRLTATEALQLFQTPYSRRSGIFAREKAIRWLVFAEWAATLGSEAGHSSQHSSQPVSATSSCYEGEPGMEGNTPTASWFWLYDQEPPDDQAQP